MSSDFVKELIVGGSSMLASAINLNPYISPALGIAWESGKLLLNKINNANPLQERFVEFINFAGQNEELIEKSLSDKNTVSGLIMLYEFVMKQRNETKRARAFRIFIGMIKSEDKENFQLERMQNVLNLISVESITFLSSTDNISPFPSLNQVKNTTLGEMNIPLMLYKSDDQKEIAYELQSLGILLPSDDSDKTLLNKWRYTNFGKNFIKYISNIQ